MTPENTPLNHSLSHIHKPNSKLLNQLVQVLSSYPDNIILEWRVVVTIQTRGLQVIDLL